jgi:hypothetical protein
MIDILIVGLLYIIIFILILVYAPEITIYLPFGSDEGDGKTPSFREGMKSSLIVMY